MGGCSEFGDSVKALPASAAKMALRELVRHESFTSL